MSGIGGVVNFAIPEVESCLPDLLARQLRYRGADGTATLVGGSAAFVYCAFHTMTESRLDSQPLRRDGIVVALDGRLDNREELRLLFDIPAERTTPAQLVLEAYRRIGPQCFARLMGDYAIALWDEAERKLVLARDPFGVCPLLYYRGQQTVVWASSAQALIGLSRDMCEVDKSFLASYLAAESDVTCSAFKNLSPVPPGHVAVFDPLRVSVRSFWRLESSLKDIRYACDEEYEERFRELFFASVRNRLCSDRPVAALLSGGLDSSSIVCVADRLLESAPCITERLQTISWVYDRARTADERDFIFEVEQQRGSLGIHLPEDDEPVLGTWPDPVFVSYPNPMFCFGGRIRQMLAAMRCIGARVLLCGTGGDHVLLSEQKVPLELADFLRQGRLCQFGRQLIRWGWAKRRSVFELFWTAALRPNFPFFPRYPRLPDWIGEDLVKNTNVTSHQRRLSTAQRGMREVFVAGVNRLVGVIAGGYGTYDSSLGRIEVRFPFLDRPLVEYLGSIPAEQLLRPEQRRSLQRRSLHAILPDRIRNRVDKKGPDEAIAVAIAARLGFLKEFFRTSLVVANGYVKYGPLLIELDRVRHGVSSRGSQGLLRLISLEMWLRSIEAWRTGRVQQWQEDAADLFELPTPVGRQRDFAERR